VLLEDIIHGGKFLYVTADTVKLVDHNHVQGAILYIFHEFPEAGAVHILAGKSLVFVIDLKFDVFILEKYPGVVFAELYLYADGITVVAVYGFARVDADCEHGLGLLSWAVGSRYHDVCS